MEEQQSRVTVQLNLDVAAALTGFRAAQHPTTAHHRLMKKYSSPLVMGPPPSEELLAVVVHLFDEEEAAVAQHLNWLKPLTAAQVALRAQRPAAEVEKILRNLAYTKFIILAMKEPQKYSLLPIVPGVFEMALMTTDILTRNSWHRTFAELFERLWDKGHIVDYIRHSRPAVRYLPVAAVGKTLHSAWPSDFLAEILEPYDLFAVGNCQCRLAMQLTGKGCGKPLENCTAIGPGAEAMIKRGLMRKCDRQEILDIKRIAEENGCVSWMFNEHGDPRGNGSCSCCGCCCHALRTITQFNTPGFVCRPHFKPFYDATRCTACLRCISACPMGAWRRSENDLHFAASRCVGCGLCVAACAPKALRLEPLAEAKAPDASYRQMLLKAAPAYLAISLRVWAKRLLTSDASNYHL